ncbi:hypothetical protein V501_01131 [Pseudogymnoascus sp. VKM F-4519 (FW-2642)]|nr:hypothetical protein V501_01131 [Pseudogymnoascus sp. VKM F-4519 (FW-2642)]
MTKREKTTKSHCKTAEQEGEPSPFDDIVRSRTPRKVPRREGPKAIPSSPAQQAYKKPGGSPKAGTETML